jgi:hypothetical protein
MGSAMSRKPNVDFIRRSPRRNPLAMPLAVGGGLLLLLVAVVVAAVLTLGRGANPTDPNAGTGIDLNPLRSPDPAADGEGLNWEIKALCEHLKARGLITHYEINQKAVHAFDYNVPNALAKRPDGSEVAIYEHSGPMGAEKHAAWRAALHDVVYIWGRFDCYGTGKASDAAATVLGKLKGARRFDGQGK